MKYLIFPIPTQKKLTRFYKINDKISLFPNEKWEFQHGFGTSFLRSILYVEKIDDIYNHDLIYENLKEFIRFWVFIISESYPIRILETSTDWPKIINEIPDTTHSDWNGHQEEIFNPSKTQIRVSLHINQKEYELEQLFQLYTMADIKLKDLISLSLHHPNRYVIDTRRKIYDNYIMESAMDWIIIDALLPKKTCESEIECPNKCEHNGKTLKFKAQHPIEPFKKRLKRLIENFEDNNQYCKIIDSFRSKRGKAFHEGSVETMPETLLPDIDFTNRKAHRKVTLEETVQNLGEEGLATMNATILLSEITRTLLLNNLIPNLNFWPKFEMLQLSRVG